MESYDHRNIFEQFYLVKIGKDMSCLYVRSAFKLHARDDYIAAIRLSLQKRAMATLFYFISLIVFQGQPRVL